MLFTVVLITCMVIFSKINGCPSQRYCTTAVGTPGTCIQAKECPDISKFNGVNLTPEEITFLRKSICGMDLDKSKLFCCDNTAIKLVSNRQDNIEVSRPASINIVEESQAEYHTSTTVTPTRVPIATSKPPEPEIPVYCRTPNGERSQCVSIYDCKIFLSNVANTTESQKKFLKESVCGFDNSDKPLVCCGSDTNFAQNNDGELHLRLSQNPLIPVGYCGLQGNEIEEQRPLPVIRQRIFQNPGRATMNFTLPNRIFGGTNSDLGEFPWTALLAYDTREGKKIFACGGSLISSRYILTAAHCVLAPAILNYSNNLTGVRLGEWDYSKNGRDCITTDGQTQCNEEEVTVGIESITVHPEYFAGSREKYHDIALIRLDRNVTFTKNIRPICLPSSDDYLIPGEKLTVSGWGLINYNEETTIKQKVLVPAISRSQCSVMFEKSSRLTQIGRGQFCAGGEPGKDACVGDSGAPIMRKQKSTTSDLELWVIEGIVSFGTGCGLANQYGVYTKVSEYIEWIHSTIVP